jgi:hypothetical protein
MQMQEEMQEQLQEQEQMRGSFDYALRSAQDDDI